MSTKKDYTIEELESQYKLAEEKANAIRQQIEHKKKEEKERRYAQLALERDHRKNEVDEALETYKTLLKAYMRDYGSYVYASNDSTFDMLSSKFWNNMIN